MLSIELNICENINSLDLTFFFSLERLMFLLYTNVQPSFDGAETF